MFKTALMAFAGRYHGPLEKGYRLMIRKILKGDTALVPECVRLQWLREGRGWDCVLEAL